MLECTDCLLDGFTVGLTLGLGAGAIITFIAIIVFGGEKK